MWRECTKFKLIVGPCVREIYTDVLAVHSFVLNSPVTLHSLPCICYLHCWQEYNQYGYSIIKSHKRLAYIGENIRQSFQITFALDRSATVWDADEVLEEHMQDFFQIAFQPKKLQILEHQNPNNSNHDIN